MKNLQIKDVTITAIFTALVYVATAFLKIEIPMGGGLLHLGDFVAILVALLFSPIIGAITGSLGMGIFDIVYGYSLSTILRTIIVKLFLGLVVGYAFKFIKRRRTKLQLEVIVLISAIIGMTVNIGLTFVVRIMLTMPLDGYTFEGAFANSASKMPSSIIKAIVTVVLVPIIYRFLYNAIKNSLILGYEEKEEDDFFI